jgi:hypothetical protein
VDRRRFVTGLAALGVGSAAIGTASAERGGRGRGRNRDDDVAFELRQGGTRVELTPLSGDRPVEEFYDWEIWRTSYSSAGTTALQRPDTSILFLYEGPTGDVSLVVVHGNLDEDPEDTTGGGSATFSFVGLPPTGRWRVQDDQYEAPTNYDRWDTDGGVQTVDWTWMGGRTDGGAYGPLGRTRTVLVRPSFNEAAALYGQYHQGDVDAWEALSGDLADPDRHAMAMDQPVLLVQTGGRWRGVGNGVVDGADDQDGRRGRGGRAGGRPPGPGRERDRWR